MFYTTVDFIASFLAKFCTTVFHGAFIMIYWLECYYQRNDNRFMKIIQHPRAMEKYLSLLYQHRLRGSLLFLVFTAVWIFVAVI